LFVAYRHFDASLPDVIAINNVVHDLSNGPTTGRRLAI
jgi:hypothetical protein